MNEWGEHTIDAEKIICIRNDGVIEAIQNNNPAITSIIVEAFDDDSEDEEEGEFFRVDWAAAGACLGYSETVKYLELKVDEYDSSENIQIFCTGMVLNQSIEHLVIRCGFEEGYNADNGAIERLAMQSSKISALSSNTILSLFRLSLHFCMMIVSSLRAFTKH